MVANSEMTPDRDIVETAYSRLNTELPRFLRTDATSGQEVYSAHRLAVLVTEIVIDVVEAVVAKRTETMRAELDAATDAVVELIGQLDDATRALTDTAARR